jgi:hemerythrin superfamily protein
MQESAMPASRPATPAPAASQQAPQDALQLLIAEHREAQAMFQQYDQLAEAGGKGDERMLLASQICVALTLHTQVEEELLYPAAREVLPGDEDIVDEAYVEHASAKSLVAQIKTMTSDQPLFDAKVKVLGEYVDHHVKEEEDELFPRLRKTALDLQALGERIAARKKQLMALPEPS